MRANVDRGRIQCSVQIERLCARALDGGGGGSGGVCGGGSRAGVDHIIMALDGRDFFVVGGRRRC